jgi:transcriptional regulator NrdR family protein
MDHRVVDIVKHGGKRPTEQFTRKKLHDSIVAVCLCVRTPEGQAEAIAHAVCDAVTAWLQQHPEVTSNDIRLIATKHLRTQHPEAAYLYEQHNITI